MRNRFFGVLCCAIFVCNAQYQDVLLNNVIVAHGSQECGKRYDAIRPLLQKYKRPITVLDIGASQGYFSFRMAHEFDASCVMVEGNYYGENGEKTADELEKLCILNTNLRNIILLKKHISPDELQILSECEHFDVVLALNVIHHFGNRWKQVIDALLNMGDYIIIETPPQDDVTAAGSPNIGRILDYLQSKKGTLLGQFPRPTNPLLNDHMFLFAPMKRFLQRIHWDNSLPANRLQDYEIRSSFTEKNLYKRHENTVTPWVKGINLLTFKKLNGVYPSKDDIRSMLLQFATMQHNDFKIWNLIIQGQTIVPIDIDSPMWANKPYDFVGDFNEVLALATSRTV